MAERKWRAVNSAYVCVPASRVRENKKRHKCHVCSELTQDDIAASAFRAITASAFEIQSILLNDSAPLRFAGHDKGERPEACPKTVGWLASSPCTNVGPSARALNRAVISSLAEGTNPTDRA